MPIKKITSQNVKVKSDKTPKKIIIPKKGGLQITSKVNSDKVKAIQIATKNSKAGNTMNMKTTIVDPYEVLRLAYEPSVFNCETNGVWTLAHYDLYIKPDLVYIKTQNTGSGKVEVHIASARSNYKTRILDQPTTFACESNGTWLLAYYDDYAIPDLVYIKTQNTSTGKVELHIASGRSGYQERILEIPTTFACESNGTWLMRYYDDYDKPDLIYIKTSNTQTNKVEIHIASARSGYNTRILEVPTTFNCEDEGAWTMDYYDDDDKLDLFYIKTHFEIGHSYEVHIASGSSNYADRILEIPISMFYTGTSYYYQFSPEWAWLTAYYDDDYIPDIAQIQTTNTQSGKVEVSFVGSHCY